MANVPTIETVHIDAAMTAISVAYKKNEFVAERIMPVVGVAKKSDKYYIHDREHWRDDVNDLRRPGDTSREVRWSVSTDNYSAEGHSRTGILPDELRANSDPPVQAEIRTTQLATEKVLLRQEINFRGVMQDTTDVFTVGNGNYADKSGAKWYVDGTSSDNEFVKEVRTAAVLVQKKIGLRPNTVLMNRDVAEALKDQYYVVDRFKYTANPGPLFTDTQLAMVFPGMTLVVADAIEMTAGFETESPIGASDTDFILGNHVWLVYVAPAPGLQIVSFAYTFRWTAVAGGQGGMVVERERIGGRKSDAFHVHKYYDQHTIDVQAAYMFATVI